MKFARLLLVCLAAFGCSAGVSGTGDLDDWDDNFDLLF